MQDGNTQKDGDDSWKAFLGGNVLYEPEGVWMYNAVRDSGLNIKAYDFPVFTPEDVYKRQGQDRNGLSLWRSSGKKFPAI